MSNKHGWLVLMTLVALLLAACGPEMATPTAGAPAPTASNASAVPPSGDLPVDPDDWRALGAPDAPVTVIEYSDFQ
jgi:protein-disulfide isomerase